MTFEGRGRASLVRNARFVNLSRDFWRKSTKALVLGVWCVAFGEVSYEMLVLDLTRDFWGHLIRNACCDLRFEDLTHDSQSTDFGDLTREFSRKSHPTRSESGMQRAEITSLMSLCHAAWRARWL